MAETLEVTGPVHHLADKGFDNAMGRFKISSNEVWQFYGEPDFENLLFTATGPVGWTGSPYVGFISSVRPVRASK